VRERLQPVEIGGVAGGQDGTVTDGDRRDHQIDAPLTSRRPSSGGDDEAKFAVNVGFTLTERHAVAIR
jgi:hypothetical protein